MFSPVYPNSVMVVRIFYFRVVFSFQIRSHLLRTALLRCDKKKKKKKKLKKPSPEKKKKF